MADPARSDGLIDATAEAEWMPDQDVESDNDCDAPSSNVRLSEPHDPAQNPAPPNVDLTFKVYTLAELEHRSDAPVAMRMSRAQFDALPPRRNEKLRAAWAALRALAAATVAWWKTKNELGRRESPMQALRPAFDSFGDAAQTVVEAVDWRKQGVTFGIAVGASFTVLFGVLLCAELSDDLKPGAGPHLANAAALDVAPPPSVEPTFAAPAEIVAAAASGAPATPAAPAARAVADETEGDAPAAPARPSLRRVKKRGLTFRNPDAIFNP